MDKVQQSSIQRGDLIVPAGWIARIPSIKLAKEEEHAMYLSYLQKQGYGPSMAAGILRRRMQDVFNRGWLVPLRDMIADRAQEYVEMHGDLEGFDPERLQRAYFPGDRPGRAGKPGVRRMLHEMREGEG